MQRRDRHGRRVSLRRLHLEGGAQDIIVNTKTLNHFISVLPSESIHPGQASIPFLIDFLSADICDNLKVGLEYCSAVSRVDGRNRPQSLRNIKIVIDDLEASCEQIRHIFFLCLNVLAIAVAIKMTFNVCFEVVCENLIVSFDSARNVI